MAILICIINILNGLALHCLVIKWFYEDITNYLFHFLENDVHDSCPTSPISNANFSLKISDYSRNSSFNTSINVSRHDHHNNENILFQSNYLLKLTELSTNFIYFLCLIFSKNYQKIKSSENFIKKYYLSLSANNPIKIAIHCLSSSRTDVDTNTNSDQNSVKLHTIKELIYHSIFYLLALGILVFTLSIKSFKFFNECEAFFKRSDDHVRI